MLLTLVAVGTASAATWQLAGVDWGLDAQRQPGQHTAVTSWREWLVDRPLDGAAFRALGDKAADTGDQAAALGFYRIAVRRDPRDPLVRVTLFDTYLANGDATAAVQHLDALLRVSPGVGQPFLQRVLGSMDDANLRSALVSRLALDPPWRELLPVALAASSDLVSAEKLLTLLGRSASLREPEAALRASLLERLDRPLDARNAWGTALPSGLRALDGLIFDGGFESGEGPEPYGWRLRSPVGAAVGLDTSHPAQGRRSLVLLFDGRAVDFSGVSQDLVLKPGSYRLDLQADLALVSARPPFAWTVACRSTNTETARLELPARTHGWERFSILFDVPPSCPIQRLALVHEGRTLTERQLSGRMAFDALNLYQQRR